MPSAPIKKPMISVQLPEKNRRQPARPQPIPKKMPHSQKPSVATPNETSDTLDDLSFLRLPEVKAVTGLSKTSIYDLIREKSFLHPSGWDRAQLLGSSPKSDSGPYSACTHRDRLLNAVGRFPAIWGYRWTRKSIDANADSALPAFGKLRIQIVGPPLHHRLCAASDTSHDCRQRPPCCASVSELQLNMLLVKVVLMQNGGCQPTEAMSSHTAFITKPI